MSKLKVGDIVINDNDIFILNQTRSKPPLSPSLQESSHFSQVERKALEESLPPSHFLEKLPLSYYTLYITGFSILSLGIVLHFIFHGSLIAIPLLTSGLGAVYTGFFKQRLLKKNRLLQEKQATARLEIMTRTLEPLLASQTNTKKTTKWLSEKAHLDETEVVHILFYMLKKGFITEDLCEESGEWHYSLIPREANVARDLRSLPLHERVKNERSLRK